MATAIWGAHQWLRLTKELTWGTFDGTGITPTPGTSVSIWIRLMEDAYMMDGTPSRWTIRSADGGNLRTQRGTQRIAYNGRLRTPLYPAQAQHLIPWFFSPTGTPLRTLPSWTADHFNGVETLRTVGVRPSAATLSCEDSDQGVIAMLDLTLVGKDQVTGLTLAEPAASVFPSATQRPYTHTDIAGEFSLGGSVRSAIDRFSLSVRNFLFVKFHESTRIDRANYCGRDVDVSIRLADPTATDRTRFEAQTALALVFGFDIASPASSVTFDAQSQNYYGQRTVDRRFNEDQYLNLTLEAFKDASTGVDASVTIVSPP